jgi:hypothetical protein
VPTRQRGIALAEHVGEGAHGNQMRSLPVLRKRGTSAATDADPIDRDNV